ncbi:lactase-phlorizin hydrolase [Achlya hypogyna]|uniref:Lactase-phlorizin hydrolase n=1 Tax=Achlya hypogyna TaxID=1202772 RepID=A0A1V9YGP0_ACHHY|nr:lactase-phlorizin hydrolase [Achlya hypogyna]
MGLLAALVLVGTSVAAAGGSSQCFPDGFLLGTATASYQVEGGVNETGRTPSIWDDFCLSRENVQCATVADDMLHRYKSDIAMMEAMGLTSFRLSISWSRVMTWNSVLQRMVRNDAGIAFYHDLIDAVVAAKMAPIVTLYHWDLPSVLHTEKRGWLSRDIVPHFKEYANLMFDEFGHKVPYWTTFNEPWSFCVGGYGEGYHAPGLSHSDTASYEAAHHVLLAHAAVVRLFRSRRHQFFPSARIGIVLNSGMAFPLDPTSAADVAAAERKLQFILGWFLSPIVYGDYPAVMKQYAGEHLPVFTPEEKAHLAGTYDVFMLNYYSSELVTDCSSPRSGVACDKLMQGWHRDAAVDSDRFPHGARPASVNTRGESNCAWFNGYPDGYLPLMRWLHAHNTSAPILLTENGWCGNTTIDNADQLWYFQTHLDRVWQGLQEGLPLIGYTAWSFLDNYEWGSFEPRFGLFYVNYSAKTGGKEVFDPLPTELQRIPRPAATWFGQVAQTGCLPPVAATDLATVPHAPWLQTLIYVGYTGPMAVAAVAMMAFYAHRAPRALAADEATPLLRR